MDTLKVMFKNGWTTAVGFVGGVVYYLANSGAKIPSTKEEMKTLLVAAIFAGLGLTSKSATVGSKPQ